MGIVLGKLCHLVFDCKFILAISQLIERNKPLSQNKVRVQRTGPQDLQTCQVGLRLHFMKRLNDDKIGQWNVRIIDETGRYVQGAVQLPADVKH